jgi:hypothetical protein
MMEPTSRLERVTLNITPRTVVALDEAMVATGDTKTDVINRAVQVYAYLHSVMEGGGRLYVRDHPGDELERLRFF